MRRERDELAARLAEIERAEPVAWIERITGRLAAPTDEHRTRFPMVYRPLIDRPTPAQRVSAADEFPAAAPVQAEDLDADIIEAQRAVLQQLAGQPACGWPGKCRHKRPASAAAAAQAEPADPLTPPPGCRLLGDYEPAQAGDLAYIGAIAGRWRRVKPRMGIIGATMDELSDGGRVLALARPLPLTRSGAGGPAPAAAPERAEPNHTEDARGMVCAVAGLVGRDRVVCDHSRSAGEVCVSPRECVHQRPQTCRCGPEHRCSACPRGER